MKKLIILLSLVLMITPCFAETSEYLYVTAKLLNGRNQPTKKSKVEAFFDQYDLITPTGEWSPDYNWVEVYGGESGTVWCNIKYLSETLTEKTYINDYHGKVKIRKHPVNGKVIGYLKSGKQIKIHKIINGWGRCKTGWIDTSYLSEVENDE